jgi:hypothetical protein
MNWVGLRHEASCRMCGMRLGRSGVSTISSKVLQRVLNVLHVDYAPRAPSSSACILFNKHRADRQEQENIRGGTQGAAKRVGFARSGPGGRSGQPDPATRPLQPAASPSFYLKGHSKKKVTDPYVVGWFLGSPKSTRVGQIFFEIFLSCFCTPLTEKRPKT